MPLGGNSDSVRLADPRALFGSNSEGGRGVTFAVAVHYPVNALRVYGDRKSDPPAFRATANGRVACERGRCGT